MNKSIKEIAKKTIAEAIRPELKSVAEQFAKQTSSAKKTATLGIIVGAGALVHSIMVGRQNVALLNKMKDQSTTIDQMQTEIDSLIEASNNYDAQVDEMTPEEEA